MLDPWAWRFWSVNETAYLLVPKRFEIRYEFLGSKSQRFVTPLLTLSLVPSFWRSGLKHKIGQLPYKGRKDDQGENVVRILESERLLCCPPAFDSGQRVGCHSAVTRLVPQRIDMRSDTIALVLEFRFFASPVIAFHCSRP